MFSGNDTCASVVIRVWDDSSVFLCPWQVGERDFFVMRGEIREWKDDGVFTTCVALEKYIAVVMGRQRSYGFYMYITVVDSDTLFSKL